MRAFVILCGLALAAASARAPEADALEAIRDYAIHYARNLPNYTCTESIRRVTTIRNDDPVPRPPVTDTFEEQLSVIDHKEVRKVTKANGNRVKNADPSEFGTNSRGEFGHMLEVLFAPETKADFKFERIATEKGRKLYVFSFAVPQGTGYGLDDHNRTIRTAYKGSFFADFETKAVMRVEMKCVDIPRSIYIDVEMILDFKPIVVGGREFTLPWKQWMLVRTTDGATETDAEYRNYRRFGSDATITFDQNSIVR
jgi:hypothetical protein